MRRTLAITILIAVLALGAFFRINIINDQSLWLDEGITYYNSSGDSYADVWDRTAKLDQSPPGYYFLMHSFLEVFGENEFGFRFIPIIFGVLSILFLYLLLAEMFDYELGLIAAILLAVNPLHIGFSVESRMYVLLSLESLMAFYFLFKAMDGDKRGYLWWLLFVVSSIFGLYTHNFFFFILLAFAFIYVLLLFFAEKKIGKLLMGLLSAILVIIAYIPWIPNLILQLNVERYWMAENTFWDLKNYYMDFAAQNMIVFYSFIVLGALAIIWCFVRIKAIEYRRGIYSVLSLMLFLLISAFTPLIYSYISEPILKLRYTVYLLPVSLALVAIGIYALRRIHFALALSVLIVISVIINPLETRAYPQEFGEDFRALISEVKKRPAEIVVHTPSINHVIEFYNNGHIKVYPFPLSDDLRDFNVSQSDEVKYKDLIRRFDKFYLVVSHTHEYPHGLLRAWSNSVCGQMKEIIIEGIETFYYSDCR